MYSWSLFTAISTVPAWLPIHSVYLPSTQVLKGYAVCLDHCIIRNGDSKVVQEAAMCAILVTFHMALVKLSTVGIVSRMGKAAQCGG